MMIVICDCWIDEVRGIRCELEAGHDGPCAGRMTEGIHTGPRAEKVREALPPGAPIHRAPTSVDPDLEGAPIDECPDPSTVSPTKGAGRAEQAAR